MKLEKDRADERKEFLNGKENEKFPKVKTLFNFIEYLHSNIENFNQYDELIEQLVKLKTERNKLKPQDNYKDKLQYDKIQIELVEKFDSLQKNTANLIKAEAKELGICNFENEPNYNFNGVENEIRQLKNDFNDEDLLEISLHKSKYIEYRTKTHPTFLSLQFFFDKLDRVTKSLFDYFKDTDRNEYEPFEIKTISVDSLSEAFEAFKRGNTKVLIPSDTILNRRVEIIDKKSDNTKNHNSLNKLHLKEDPHLKDLFMNNGVDYDRMINLLVEHDFLTKNANGTLNWKGAKEDKSLSDKTLICTLAIVLDEKDYFEPNLTNTYISKALTNTFKNFNIIPKTYGETLRNFSYKPQYNKVFFFIT